MGELVMTITTAVVGGVLALTYTVRNDTKHDAYLLNRLYTDSPPAMTADIAWVELDFEGQTANVTKGMPDLPAGSASGPPVPMSPYVTPLRAGASFTETIKLPLPLHIVRAFGRSPQSTQAQGTLVPVHRLNLSVQYYWREPGMTETASKAFGQPVILPGGFRGPLRFGLVRASSEPLTLQGVKPAPERL
jgi:hypothetical protein